MRIWIDLTNSPHVMVMRPLIELLPSDGHDVAVTARDFSGTLDLLERFGVDHVALGRLRGGQVASKARGLLSRSAALVRWARGRRFDLPMGHGSNDITVAARLLGVPSATAFDYEWAVAALGTPVYTTLEGRPGGVDEALIADGRLERLSDPAQVRVEKRRSPTWERVGRDPRELLKLFVSALP